MIRRWPRRNACERVAAVKLINHQSLSAWGRILPVLVVSLLGLGISAVAFLLAGQQEALRAETEFFRRADVQHAALQGSLNRQMESLGGLQRRMRTSPRHVGGAFHSWAGEIAATHPEIQVIEWAPRVSHEERPFFEDNARRNGQVGFVFRERGLDNVPRPARQREEYFPIYFCEPLRGNEPILGLDVAVGQTARETQQARDTGLPVVSGRMRMMQTPGEQPGLILILPVYRDGALVDTVENRRAALNGYVRGVFRVQDLLASTWRGAAVAGVETLVLDASALHPTNRVILFHASKGLDAAAQPPSEDEFRRGRHYESNLQLGGRRWTLLFRPVPEWWSNQLSWLPWFIFTGGLGSTALAVFYIRAARRRTEVIEQTVATRTEELRQTQNTLVTAQRIGRVGSWEKDLITGGLVWSEETFRILGFDPKSYRPSAGDFLAIVHLDDRARVESSARAAVESNAPYDLEHRIMRRDGQELIVHELAEVLRDAAGRPVRMIGTVQDVTERRRAEEQRQLMERKFQETQKLESLGVLAGGIAHDFNNLLTGILGNACLARMETSSGSSIHAHLEQIESSSLRAAELCKQMLAYSGKGRFVIQRIDLDTLVDETMHLLQLSISKKAVLKINLATGLPGVMGDATQIRQIIMNLVMNASDAIGERSGVIHVRTAFLHAGPTDLVGLIGASDLTPGDYVLLEVTDNGCGMSAETQAKMFEPFFTTKFTGRGLGLAAVLGIVRGHGGALKVSSELDRGTTFKLLLPATGVASVESKVERRLIPQWRGQGTVLVVDDEDGVRLVAGRMLQKLGFDILSASDGEKGLEVYRARHESICAVLLDLTMPRMDGEETFREIRRIRPDACVVLMSGFNEQDAAARFVGKGLAGFVQKPFTPDELRERLTAFGRAAKN